MYCLLLLKCNKNYCEVEIMMKADCVKISFTLNVMNNKLVTNISIIYGHVLHFLIFLQLMVNYLHKYVYKTILQVFHTMFRYFTAILSQNCYLSQSYRSNNIDFLISVPCNSIVKVPPPTHFYILH